MSQVYDPETKTLSHYEEGFLHGKSIQFDDEGNKIAETLYENGRRQGLHIRLKDNQIVYSVTYKDDLKEGDATTYTNGKKTNITQYRADKKEGNETEYDPISGDVIHATTWVDDVKHGMETNLQTRESIDWVYGKQRTYQIVRNLPYITHTPYIDDKRNGREIKYIIDGYGKETQYYQCDYKDDLKHGDEITFHGDGTSKTQWVDGKKHGSESRHGYNCEWIDGKKHGEESETSYSSEYGQPVVFSTKTSNWIDGQLYGPYVYNDKSINISVNYIHDQKHGVEKHVKTYQGRKITMYQCEYNMGKKHGAEEKLININPNNFYDFRKETSHYVNDILHGKVDSGDGYICDYKMGQKHGCESKAGEFEYHYRDGILHGLYYNIKEGIKCYYHMGVKHGKENKKVPIYKKACSNINNHEQKFSHNEEIESNYNMGKLDGHVITHVDGKIRKEKLYKNGVCIRIYVYSEAQQAPRKPNLQPYIEDLLNGLYVEWSSTGIKLKEELYRNGKKHGLCKAWRPDGSLMYKSQYEDGNEI